MNAGERIAAQRVLASKLARFVEALPESARVRHRDLIPRALLVRIGATLGRSTNLVDPASGEAIGILERGREPVDDATVEGMRDCLASALVGPCLFVPDEAPRIPESPTLGLVEFEDERGTYRLYLDLTRRALVDRPAPPRDPATPLRLSVHVGRTRLAHAELRALETGDLITLDAWFPDRPRGGLEGVGELHAFVLEGGVMRSLGPATEDDRCFEEAFEDELDDELAPIDDARVTIDVELCRIATTVGELATLVPGAILATEVPEPSTVTLRVGGRAIARGVLTRFEGEPAIRILELATRAAARDPRDQ